MTIRQVTQEQNQEKFDWYGPFTYQNVIVTFSLLSHNTDNRHIKLIFRDIISYPEQKILCVVKRLI